MCEIVLSKKILAVVVAVGRSNHYVNMLSRRALRL
jgi:hypothetical protein